MRRRLIARMEMAVDDNTSGHEGSEARGVCVSHVVVRSADIVCAPTRCGAMLQCSRGARHELGAAAATHDHTCGWFMPCAAGALQHRGV